MQTVPLHPVIVHTPIALILFSLLFEIVGRATDSDWWRKASFAMLVFGMLGAGAALLSGERDAERVERQAGVPETALESHEEAGKIALWITVGAVAARILSGGTGTARAAIGVVALLLHLCAAGAVGVAGWRGGELVYRHGGGVRLEGGAELAGSRASGADDAGERHESEAGGDED